MENKLKKLVLIDGNAIIHRSYHAIPSLMTKEGELVNAVYGFASTLLSVIDKFQPDYILASFDLLAPTFRHQEFPDYKANRTKAPDDLYAQIDRVKEVTRAMGIPIYEKEGFEADDLIGTMAQQAKQETTIKEIIIVTGDLDTLQLVNEKTKVYTMRRGITDSVFYDRKKIQERYGLTPEQIIDFKGLRGDPSDNIPGVKGIGEKTASTLLQKYSTIENVYKHLEEIKGAIKDKLARDKMQALQSKRLATIVKNVAIKINLKEAKTNKFNREKIVTLFQELNFYSLIKRLPSEEGELRKNNSQSGGVKDFKYQLISKENKLKFLELLNQQKEVAIKLKTRGEKNFKADILGIAIAYKKGRAGYLEFKEENYESIKSILENSKISKIGYDLKKNKEVLAKAKITLRGELFDIMLSAYVLNPGSKVDFSQLVLASLGEEIEEEKKKGQLGLEMETLQNVASNECQRADYIFKLKFIYENKIKEIIQTQNPKYNLVKIFREIEMPLVKILAEMELTGIKLNTVLFQGIAEKIEIKIKNLEKNIYQLAGIEFNINSPKQLAEILFVRLKISTEGIKKGKTNFSTASAELGKLKNKHKIISKIEEYREVFKLKTTYLDTLPKMVDENSRLHTTYNQAVTATGRLSSSDPNLQNIPIRTELGQLLRVAFEAKEGFRFVSADYSQIDLRAVAHVAKDKKMIELFWQGKDIHLATAAEINKVAPSQVTEKMRSSAKALNFGVIYGMSAFGFSQSAKIEKEEAKKFIEAYMKKFPGVANYMKTTKELAKKRSYVETEMGRRRYLPEINSPNFKIQNSAERMAINMPIQGMSADIMKLAMIAVFKEYENNPAVKMVLQVHDEIILEVKESLAEEVAKKTKAIMEQVYALKVPLVVDVKIGDNWGEL